MGVPRLFKYINDNYSNCIEKYDRGERAFHVDNLLFDANALIHNAANEIVSQDILPAYGGVVERDPIEVRIYKLFMQKIDEYVHMFPPMKMIYIAIDGCAPLGKQAQQRQRRYISAQNSTEEGFDRCCITPGTTFMLNLTRYINTNIRIRMLNNDVWSRVKVYFSPPSVPGEGEHKLLDFIRDNYKTMSKQSTCMYGPDGDLIMLGLATYCPKFHLIREDLFDSSKTTCIDIGTISQYIVKDLGQHIVDRDKRAVDVLNDFILLGFFVGNDFLPKIQMFHLLEEGIDTMITVYKSLTKTLRTTITKSFNIDTKMFERFIMAIAKRENELLQEQTQISVNDEKFLNITLLECTVNRVGTENGVVKNYRELDFQRYRVNYYEKKLGIVRDTLSQKEYKDRIAVFCKEYMDGLYWVFKYYVEGCPSMRWFYGYHYAPLFADFVHVFRLGWSPPIFRPEEKEASTPFQQLLTVLPPSSSKLLPREYAKLMREGGPLNDFYSNDFDMDYEGKLKEYQGIALLPFVDFDTVLKEYNSVVPRYDYTRNRPGRVSIFTFDRNKSTTYLSKYGTIYNCKIAVQKI